MNVTRFAPSPTGFLHLGHAHSAWFSAEQGQQFLLRIENIDTIRCQKQYEDSIFEDLHWLGLTCEHPVRRQSEHVDEYKSTLSKLNEMGLIYPCFCTRKDIEYEIAQSPSAPHGPDGHVYPRTCLSMSMNERQERIEQGQAYALRLNMKEAMHRTGPLTWRDVSKGTQKARPDLFGDVVLARKDTPASYHLCVTHDDALQGVNLVTRGEDLFSATHVHRILQALLGYPEPLYHHHPLITDPNGKKFSKRDKSLTIQELRNKGFSPDQLRDMIANQDFSAFSS